MTTILIITVGAVGFALGLYVSSQIMEHIIGKPSNKLLKNSNYYFVYKKGEAEHCWWAVAHELSVRTSKVMIEIQISCTIFSFIMSKFLI